MDITKQYVSMNFIVAAVLISAVMLPVTAEGGGYIFARNNPNIANLVTHPANYNGAGGTVDVNVCIIPGSPNATDMEQSIINNIATWNKNQSTTSNLRFVLPGTSPDFESVALHELGHCVGLSHPNLATESGVADVNYDFTASIEGPNNVFSLDAGVDGVKGSADDIRGDDINMHYSYIGTNNPFSEQAIVDSTNYDLDLASLPLGDTFPANADRTVSGLARFGSPNTEAVMQQGSFGGEIQRTLGHDDVSTLRYAMSGVDEIQGTGDDYKVNLTYGGISSSNCDINVGMSATETGFAVCRTTAALVSNSNNHARITSADVFFNPNFDWYFNDTPPCNESFAMTAAVWKMVSLPCQVGISTSAALIDVFGDDLGTTNYNVDWVVFEYEYTEQAGGLMAGAYRMLAMTDELDSSKGYWLITNEAGKTIDVQGEYNSQMDADLFINSATGQAYGWNMVGMPFRHPVIWADARAVDPVGNLLTLQQSDPIVAGGVIPGGSGTACSDGPLPTSACKVAQFAFKYNQAILDYEILGPTSGTLVEWDAAWVFAGDTDYAIRFPMPTLERTSP